MTQIQDEILKKNYDIKYYKELSPNDTLKYKKSPKYNIKNSNK